MNSLELKHIISEQLLLIEDESFLQALKTIIETKIGSKVYNLNQEEEKSLIIARQDLNNKNTISHDDLQLEINKWLDLK